MKYAKRLFICAGLVMGAALLATGLYWERGAEARTLDPVSVDLDGAPARYLSAYNLFKDNAGQVPNDGVVPYALNTPLFSDYAAKHRFVYVPDGQAAAYDDVDVFDFPVGTVIVKTFSYLNDIRDPAQGERIIETRLLIHKESGWVGLPYLWEDDMSDARLAVAGATVDVSWTHVDGAQRELNYIVPNMNQCKQCHEIGDRLQPIGPKARHLNGDFDYPDGAENQLAHWVRQGILEGAPADPADAPRVPRYDDPEDGTLAARARAWLDINCMHCHNAEGAAHTSGLHLSFFEDSPSILVHRITTTDPGQMMPTLPRRVMHDEGVALIREWIAQMEPADAGAK